jgi:glycine/D-amino acid oxidase-like deaminating enzyme
VTAGAETTAAPDLATTPLWWKDAPPEPADREPLPERVDVAVVGSGYCGLSCALELARAGTSVAALDRQALGAGASSRNGGMVGGAVRLDCRDLARHWGNQQAQALVEGFSASFDHLESLLERERIAAGYERCGRFVAACNPAQFRRLERQVRALGERDDVRLVTRARQREEIGSDLHYGGVVIERSGGLHPARLQRGLSDAARAAGAGLHGHAGVQRIERDGSGFALATARGRLRAAALVIATNGYTGALTPELQRRVIPVSSYIIATEELPADLAARLSPKGRMFVDGNRLLSYFRLSPDRRRVLFGGRVSLADVDERRSAQRLRRRLLRVWPELAGCRITHSWKGSLAFTFDHLPHMGESAGAHFAMGCNGSGVAMACYLGHQIAQKLLGRTNRACPFDGLRFPTHPLYRGRPWFLPAVGAWYRWRDRLEAWRPG